MTSISVIAIAAQLEKEQNFKECPSRQFNSETTMVPISSNRHLNLGVLPPVSKFSEMVDEDDSEAIAHKIDSSAASV